MLGGHLDENESESVRIRDAKLDEAPWFFHSALENPCPCRDELPFGMPHVANLEPELGRCGGGFLLPIGDLEVATSQKKHDAARGTGSELAHRVKADNITVKGEASVEVAWVQHETAGKNLHDGVSSEVTLYE